MVDGLVAQRVEHRVMCGRNRSRVARAVSSDAASLLQWCASSGVSSVGGSAGMTIASGRRCHTLDVQHTQQGVV
eukprot:2519195-Prymnesium_polylepis.1